MINTLYKFEGHNHFEGGVVDFRSQNQPGERVEGLWKHFSLPPQAGHSIFQVQDHVLQK